MTDTALRASGLGKKYHLGSGPAYGRLTESVFEAFRAPFRRSGRPEGTDAFWALRDVSFEIERGEVVGIIGRNGAGKTTLLKVLSRITEPTEGVAEIDGRIGTLLEVGTGFHPELTGRENVYLNGAILGMNKREIDRRFDQIVSFAEIDRFLETPVKRYSSGMYVRLAFSVAAHLEPDVLIVDEVLAVGDVAFQKKCLERMGDVAQEGRTVLFVSHNLTSINNLCASSFLLERGRIVAAGPTREVVQRYMQLVDPSGGSKSIADRPDREGSGALRFLTFAITDDNLDSAPAICGAPVTLTIRYEGPEDLRDVHVSVAFYSLGEGVMYLANDLSGQWFDHAPASGVFSCRIDRMCLTPGSYDVNLYSTVKGVVADWVTSAARVDVLEGDFFGSGRLPPKGYGSTLVPHTWSVDATTPDAPPD